MSAGEFTLQEIQRYMTTSIASKRVDMNGVRDNGKQDALFDAVHICGRDPARLMIVDNYMQSYGSAWPVVKGVTEQSRENIARNFTHAVGVLEEAGRNDMIPAISKDDALNAITAFHHMLDPSTPQNVHVRFVLEKAAQTLGLGVLPPEHTHRVQSPRNTVENLR